MINIKKYIFKIIQKYCNWKNPNLYYGDFIGGCFSRFENFLIGIFYKKKLITRSKFCVNKYTNTTPFIISDYVNQDLYEEFRSAGIIQIPKYFSKLVNTFQYPQEFKSIKFPSPMETYKSIVLSSIDDVCLAEIIDPFLIDILCKYEGAQVYLRAPPAIKLTCPGFQDVTSRKIYSNHNGNFANVWHHDSQFLLQWHVLMRDTSINDPHMLYAKKSNNEPFAPIDFFASEEYVTTNYEIHHCIGPAGTVYLFDGSRGWHRMMSSENGSRVTLEVMFTRGNDLMFDQWPLVNFNSFNLNKFHDIQKRVIVLHK